MDKKYLPFGFGPEEKVSISTIAFQYGWSAARLNSFLYKYDVIYFNDEHKTWLITDQYKDSGYTESSLFTSKTGYYSQEYLVWTQEGQKFIYQMLKDKLTLLPEIKMLDEEDRSDGCLTEEELAEVLIQNEIYINETSIGRLTPNSSNVFSVLRHKGYLMKKDGILYNTPCKKYHGSGLFKVFKKREPVYRYYQDEPVGDKLVYVTKVTQGGKDFFIEYFKHLMNKGCAII